MTAADPDGAFDRHLQIALLDRVVRQGAHGVIVGGTSGEFPLLSIDEREDLAAVVVGELSGQVPVVVHVGAPRTDDSIRLAQHAARIGAQGVSSVPPYFYATRAAATVEYLSEISSSTDLPFYYVHAPRATGRQLDERFVDGLADVSNLVGIEYADADFDAVSTVRDGLGGEVDLLGGVDKLLCPGLERGFVGGVGLTFNFLTPVFHRLWEAFCADDVESARRAEDDVNRIIEVIEQFPTIGAVKETVRLLDLDLGGTRPPISDLDDDECEELNESLLAAGLWDLRGVSRREYAPTPEPVARGATARGR